ncbi:hypothetical protein C8Q73DRAFT_256746 [Cubamyces lactineus]|nr:hypothetical protein C8Q73DRAFT_256746 [Cubamyces lactineus]
MSATITATLTSNAVSEYQLILNKSLEKEEDFDTISEHFAEALRKPEVQEQTIKDIRELTKTVKEIKEAFRRIGEGFVEFDGAKFLDNDNNLLQLGGQWREYQTRFQDILDRSFDNASRAAAFMHQYSKAILTDVDQSCYGDLQIELQAFVKKLESKAAEALQTKNEFTRLADDLRLFAQTVEEAVKKAGARLDNDLTAARAHLHNLQAQLEEVYHKMKNMGIACVASLAVGAVAAGVAIITLSPVAMFFAVTSVISALTTGIKYAEAKKEATRIEGEIQECNRKIAELMAKEQLLKKYQEGLEATKKEITGLAGKVDTIANIWQYLRSDMIQLSEQLALATDPDMPVTKRFLRKVAATRELYMKLATLLDMYAKSRPEDDKPEVM